MYSTTVRHPDYPKDEYGFCLPQREAVIAAYALFTMRTANSWEWEERFGPLAVRSKHAWICQGWTALDKETRQ
jgi:hypothetical protein